MRISLSKDQSSQPGEVLAHVDISVSDHPPTYSHSFRYKVPSGKDGMIIVYADKETASKDVKGDVFSFDLEKCRNKDCKAKNPGGCLVIAGKGNRLLVADIFHTMPTQNTLQYFGTALFKALFFGEAGRLLQETKSMHRNDSIFLHLNDRDLDAIPWEYAKDGAAFLVHSHKFARIFGHELERPQDPLPKLPLRIVVTAPDPLNLTELKLADLYLSDQVQNFINEFQKKLINVKLERVLPATVDKMNWLLAKHDDNTAAVLHFMGHCVAYKDDKRGLVFEDEETFGYTIANTQNIVTIPSKLRLAFLSACNSRDVARDLVQKGVRHTIGSFCPLPDDIARKSEATFYHYLAQGLPVEEAMWRTRLSFQDGKELRESDYLAGTMILYSTNCQTADNTFLCESGKLKHELNMFPNNLDIIPLPKKIFGRKKQLAELNGVLRRMATRTNDSFEVCTITGIGGQGKTTLAIEAIQRTGHFFPGGIFVYQFDDEKEISAKDYLRRMADVLFPELPPNAKLTLTLRNESGADELETLGRDISRRFKASSLLILDHAETLKRAAAENRKDAVFLVSWLTKIISRRDLATKILATSQEALGWLNEKPFPLDGFTDSDIRSGCKLFVDNLHFEAKGKMANGENRNHLLRELVRGVDGHPLTLKLLGSVISLPKHLDNSLEDIVREHYYAILAEEDLVKKSLKRHFGPMIDSFETPRRLFLYMCTLFTGQITTEVLAFASYFIDNIGESTEPIDFNVQTIVKNLEELCKYRLLFKKDDKEEYRIHVGFREGLRQHNTELKFRLWLPITGLLDDIFIIGISSEYGITEVLEWQLHNIRVNANNRANKRTFGIQYYNLGKSIIQHQISFHGLIVFIYEVSEILYDNTDELYIKQIIPIVKEEKLPFVLCLKHADIRYTDRNIVFLKKIMKRLQASLNTHLIIRTESLLNITHEQLSILQDKPISTFKKEFGNMYPVKDFIGRQSELKQLHTLFNDEETYYITIRGFGGLGKTALALQAVEKFNSGRVMVLSLQGKPSFYSIISSIAEFLDIITASTESKKLLIEVNQKLKQNLKDEKIILFYLDNMEDIKQAAVDDNGDSVTKKDTNDLIRFFHNAPKNVKVLATSRVALHWPKETIIELDGLMPQEGMQVFRLWISDRLNEVDDEHGIKISKLAGGHPLSIRLLGGTFNNSGELIDQFIKNFDNRLQEAKDYVVNEHYNSVNTCIQYSYRYLDDSLMALLSQVRLFEVPFSTTLVEKALNNGTASRNNLHKLWQQSWLNELKYDPTLGDWRPRFMEQDFKFFTLHPLIRDFLNHQSRNVKGIHKDLFNDMEIQFYIALCYGVGFGVVNDLNKQIEWCTKAATNGHLEAQLALAVCYEQGAGGVSVDLKKALDWYLKAAETGDKGAIKQMESCWRKLSDNYERQANEKKPLEIKFDLSLPLLHRAAEYNQVTLVRSLLDQPSVNINAEDRHGRTPLYIAVEKGHIELVNVLGVEFKAEVNTKDKEGRSPLHWATENKHVEVIQVLVAELGADINVKAIDGQTPLHYLARDGHTEIVRLLTTELKANTKAKDNNGQTPLHRAAANGHVEVVRLLVAKLQAVDDIVKDSNGQTPFHLAKDNGHIEVVELFITFFGTDNGQTLLFQAADNGLVEIVRLLVTDLKAGVGTRDSDGRTLLHRAADNGRLEVVKLLVAEFGIDVNIKCSKGGRTPLHEAAYNERVDVLMLLVSELKADVETKDSDGQTPFHLAVDKGDVEVMKILAKFGANVDATDNDGRTRFHLAVNRGDVEVMKILVAEFGANVDAMDNDGQTPFHLAVNKGDVEVMKILVAEFGANVDAKGKDGRTLLHLAVNKGDVEVMKLLVAEFGANVDAKDKDGRTPFHLAVNKGDVEVMKILVAEFGALRTRTGRLHSTWW